MLETLRDGGRRIRDAVAFAFADPAWVLRYLAVAVVLLIPVVGAVAMLGWQVRVYEHARLGRRTLPRVNLRADMRRGVTPFVSVALMLVVPVAVALFITLPLDAAGIPPRRYADPELVQVAFVFFVFFTYPEILRRAIVHHETLAMLKPFPSFRAIWRAPLPFFFTVVGNLAACLIAAAGVYAFVVGILFSVPVGHAVVAHLVMQWQRDLEGPGAPGG